MTTIRNSFNGIVGTIRTSRIVAVTWIWVMLVALAWGQTAAKQEPSANVAVGDQVLFAIRTRLGPFSAAERATTVSQNLARLAADVLVTPESIVLAENESSTDILAGQMIVTTVTEADARAAGVSRSVLANRYMVLIRDGISRVRSEYSYRSLAFGTLDAVLSTLALLAILVALRCVAPLVYAWIERARGTKIRPLKIQSLELVSATRITESLIHGARLVRIALTVLLFYFYIPLVFSFFPWTRSFGSTLLGYVIMPVAAGWNALVAYLPNLLVVLVTFAFAYVVIRVLRFLFRELERGTISWPGFYPEWAMPTYKIIEILIFAFALVVAFPYLPGSDSPAFRGVSIFLGVLLSLGSSSAVANIVAGVILTYTRAFAVGHRVQIADTVGDVIAKTLLATHIRTIKNVNITIPNSLVLGSHIINFSASAEGQALILHTCVTIGYDAPWRQVHALLISAASKTKGILETPEPFVFQKSLDDFYVSYEINAYTDQPSRMAVVYSELHQNIQDAFNDAGVEIMSPHYSSLRDGNTIAIPPSYLSRGYEPPGFRVQTEPDGKVTPKVVR